MVFSCRGVGWCIPQLPWPDGCGVGVRRPTKERTGVPHDRAEWLLNRPTPTKGTNMAAALTANIWVLPVVFGHFSFGSFLCLCLPDFACKRACCNYSACCAPIFQTHPTPDLWAKTGPRGTQCPHSQPGDGLAFSMLAKMLSHISFLYLCLSIAFSLQHLWNQYVPLQGVIIAVIVQEIWLIFQIKMLKTELGVVRSNLTMMSDMMSQLDPVTVKQADMELLEVKKKNPGLIIDVFYERK